MKTAKDLNVKVNYRVELRDVEMPQKVYDQILEAYENGDEIDPLDTSKYPYAVQWMKNNISEHDCMWWEAEIEVFS